MRISRSMIKRKKGKNDEGNWKCETLIICGLKHQSRHEWVDALIHIHIHMLTYINRHTMALPDKTGRALNWSLDLKNHHCWRALQTFNLPLNKGHFKNFLIHNDREMILKENGIFYTPKSTFLVQVFLALF